MFLALLFGSFVYSGVKCNNQNRMVKAGVKKAMKDGMCIRFRDKIIYADGTVVYKNNKEK